MTATQQARLEGFRISLAERGHSLTLNGEGTAFLALIEPVVVAQGGRYEVAREEANHSHVHVERTSLPSIPSIGDYLYDAETGTRYRITRINNQSANPIVIFEECEVSA
jgi:hypothetical protein